MDCLHSLEPCSYGTMNATMIHLDYLKSCSNSQSVCRGSRWGLSPRGETEQKSRRCHSPSGKKEHVHLTVFHGLIGTTIDFSRKMSWGRISG